MLILDDAPRSAECAAPQAAEEEVKRWYDRRYAERGADAMRPPQAYGVFLRALDGRPGARLLDVACGPGHLLRAASDSGLHTSGVDLSEEAVRVARSVSPDSDLRVGPSDHLRFEDSEFDYVTCLGALEHFPDPGAALLEMRRVAKDSARICIVVPNSNFLLWRIFGSGTEQEEIAEFPRALEEWEALFARSGFQVLERGKERWYLKRPRFLGKLEQVGLWLLWALLPLRHTYQFQFVLAKRAESVA